MKKSIVAALAAYFGKKPGQNTADMAAEFRAALTSDRAFWIAGMESVGFEITDK